MKLFVIYIGGKTDSSLIELHDMRFAVAEKIEDTYQSLRKSWWGVPSSLHLDCWGILNYADGYNILLDSSPQTTPQSNPQTSPQKLYFVNLGGYDSTKFTELHENIFVVAEDESTAKTKALQKIKQESNWETPHRDYLYAVENCLCLNTIAEEKALYLHLEKTDSPNLFEFTCKYVPIG